MFTCSPKPEKPHTGYKSISTDIIFKYADWAQTQEEANTVGPCACGQSFCMWGVTTKREEKGNNYTDYQQIQIDTNYHKTV